MTTEWPATEGRHAFTFPGADATQLEAAITEAVTWFGDGDPGPLEGVVDPAMLERVYGHDDDPTLSFAYADCRVRVEPGRFTVERAIPTRDTRVRAPGRD